jgi:hypothetical protein
MRSPIGDSVAIRCTHYKFHLLGGNRKNRAQINLLWINIDAVHNSSTVFSTVETWTRQSPGIEVYVSAALALAFAIIDYTLAGRDSS